MNKLTILGLPITRHCVIVIFLLMCKSQATAQTEIYTTLKKNINVLAYELDHKLSDSQDSLILENKHLFKKVRFVSKETEKVFDFAPAVKSAKISLADLPVGKYTVMFYQADKIIVFQVDRVLPFDFNNRRETDVAISDLKDVELNTAVASTEVKGIDLELDNSNFSRSNNNKDKEFEAFEQQVDFSYNLSKTNRSNVQTRADYRRTHLRPNGKPYE
ncbi:hypothetical protein [Psychroserpens sp. Hel_I_66]|uniref:hypothetical protein n=1 Tax=Psychroserpens sp. Hel_I_66 TaxID=1250004 RepID=UPI0012DFEFB7|nr:hypothetical protein [Psychroserpens sp. Hel_I_66]